MAICSWWLHGMGLFKAEYPACWKDETDCTSELIKSVTYTEISGVIGGMLTMGYIADRFGRRNGSRITSAVMLAGAIMLTLSFGTTVSGQFTMYTTALVVFGYGVGGEYPLASASAVERAHANKDVATGASIGRGKEVVMTFSMQGMGNFVQTLIMVVLLGALGLTASSGLDKEKLDIVWRVQYAIAVAILFLLSVYRFYKLKESAVWETAPGVKIITGSDDETDTRLSLNNQSPVGARGGSAVPGDVEGQGQLTKYFLFVKENWHRLIGTSIGWFVWDVCFYGNKLFQGKFISIIYGDPSLFLTLCYTLLNSFIALIGYYVAAYTIDKPWMGRWRMQMMGFSVCALTFGACGIWYDTLIKKEYLWLFQVLYQLSTFFGQWGPNATTWLLPSELFPTEIRAFAHGISAAAGKFGALTAGIWFNNVDSVTTFILSGACGLIGAFVTLFFIPDVTTLDISELDKRWSFVKAGRVDEYEGDAILPKYRSFWENCFGRPSASSSHVDASTTEVPLLGKGQRSYS